MTPRSKAAMMMLAIALPQAGLAAEVASTDLSVTATVLDSCIVSAPIGLVFATVDTGVATSQTVEGQIAVVCTAAKPNVSINMEGGDNAAGGDRFMKSASNDLLPYMITKDAAHTIEVGVNDSFFDGPLTALTPNLFSVYGQIPPGGYAAGIYTDTVRVTLNY